MDQPFPTPILELNEVLHELVSGIKSILDKSLVAVFLQGSFALGDWDAGSDVDFLVVLENELPENLLPELQTMHGRIYALPSPWAQHLEGSYISKKVLRESDTSIRLWYLDNGSQRLVQDIHCNTLVVRWTTREYGIPMFGVTSKTLIEPISEDALRLEVRIILQDWAKEISAHPDQVKNRWLQQYIVLSYCRMLQTLHTARIESKRSAAIWGQQYLESEWRELIARAWEEHSKQRENYKLLADLEDVEKTLQFVQYALQLGRQ
jgi:predicted nucleotidyltransferase